MTGANWLRLIGLSVPWGCSFLFLKLLAGELPPMTVALARLLVAAAALSLILAARGVRLAPLRAHWRSFLMLGLLNNAVPFTLISWGLTRVPSGTAAICNAMSPVFAVLVLRALGGPALAPHKLAGAVLGVAGVVVLVGPEVVAGGDLLGNLACLGAALSYGFGARHFAPIRALPTMPMVTAQLWAGILLLLPAFFISYFYNGFMSTWLTTYFTVRSRAFSSFFTNFSGIFSSFIIATLLDRQTIFIKTRAKIAFTCIVILLTGTWIWATVLQKQFYDAAEPPVFDWFKGGFGKAYALVFFWQFSGQAFQQFLYWLVGQYATDLSSLSHHTGILRGFEALGQTVAWA